MLELLYNHAKFWEAWISPAAKAAKDVKFFVCLFVRHTVELCRCTPGSAAVVSQFYYLFL